MTTAESPTADAVCAFLIFGTGPIWLPCGSLHLVFVNKNIYSSRLYNKSEPGHASFGPNAERSSSKKS